MGLPFVDVIPDEAGIVAGARLPDGQVVRIAIATAASRAVFFAPDKAMARDLRRLIATHPGEAARIRITTPAAIAHALHREAGWAGAPVDVRGTAP